MKTRVIFISVLVILLAACGNRKSVDEFPAHSYEGLNQTTQQQARVDTTPQGQTLLDQLTYEYLDVNHDQPCSTGVKKFKSAHDLCMTLLDNSANGNCANQKRFEDFFRSCSSRGYLPNDGLQCKFGILKPEIELNLAQDAETCFRQIQLKATASAQEYCIGRHAGETDQASLPRTFILDHEGHLKASVEAAYVYPNQITQKSTTHLNAHFETPETSVDFEYKAGLILKTGCAIRKIKSGNETFQVFAACKPVHGCK